MGIFKRNISAELPITLDVVKQHLKIINNTLFDEDITLKLKGAIRKAENYTGLTIASSEYTYVGEMLYVLPIDAISPINSVTITLDGVALPKESYAISTTAITIDSAIKGDELKVVINAGVEELPEDMTAAILLATAKLFHSPIDYVEALPSASQNLLRPYRRWGR